MKFPADFLLNPPRNVDGQRNARLVFRDVQKGFIQGKGFHQICVTVENGVYLRGDGEALTAFTARLCNGQRNMYSYVRMAKNSGDSLKRR